MANTFHCSIVTPERAVLETAEATFVAVPAHDGEIGFMPNRAPLLCQLGIGALRVQTSEGSEIFFVDRGFAQMVDNKLTVLTEQARKPTEIEREQVIESLEAARSMQVLGGDHLWDDERLMAIQRAKAQLNIKERHS